MIKKNAIRNNTIYLGSLQIVTMILPLLALPFLAARLGVNNYGSLILSISISQVLLLLTDYGFNLSASKLVSQNREKRDFLCVLWLEVTTSKIALSLIGYAVLFSFGMFSIRIQENWEIICISYLNVLGGALLPQWLFQGLERLGKVSIVQVGVKVFCYMLLFVLVNNENDIVLAALLLSAANLLSALLLMPSTIGVIDFNNVRELKFKNIIKRLKEGWHLFVSIASSNVYATATTPIVGLIVSHADLTFFYIAERIARGVQSLYAPIAGALFPHVSLIAINDKNNLIKFNLKVISLAAPIFMIASIILLIFSEELIGFVFREDLIEAATTLSILAPLPVLIVISNTLGIQTLVPLGKDSILSKILLSAALMSFPFLYFFTKLYGVNGAAAVLLGIELYVTLTLIFIVLKIKNE